MPFNSDKNSGFMGMKQKDNVGWRNPVAGCAAFSGAGVETAQNGSRVLPQRLAAKCQKSLESLLFMAHQFESILNW